MRRPETKLPKWLIYLLPCEEEDEVFNAFMLPIVFFFLVGIGVLWNDVINSIWIVMKILIIATLLITIFVFMCWLLEQVEILKISRKELILRYGLTEDTEEKEKIKEKLEKLHVFLK